MPDIDSFPEGSARVNGAARFAVLHEAAEMLLDDLTRQFLVERREAKEELPDGSFIRAVRLIPRTLTAAPLVVAFTDVPGVVLRLGRWFRQTLPVCGCDDCAEQPDDLIEKLRSRAAAVVEGGLWERVRRGLAGSWAEVRLIGPDFRIGQRMPLDAQASRAARREGFAAAIQWGPWPARPGKMS
jgi:hypothetical protein